MNGFDDVPRTNLAHIQVTPGLVRQIAALNTAAESICRMQRVIRSSPVLEEFLRTQQALNNSQAFKDIRRMQNAFDFSPMLEGIRKTQEALNISRVFKDIRRMQNAFESSPVLEEFLRTQQALNNSQAFKDIRRMQKEFDFSPMLEGIRKTQEALGNSSLTLSRFVRQMAKANALDYRIGHTDNRLDTHVTEAEVTREEERRSDLRDRRLSNVGQTDTDLIVQFESRRKIQRPVGSSLRGVAEFVFTKKSYEQVYEPLINDLRFEYFEALASNRTWKARWVHARGYGSFLTAMVAHAAASGGRLVVRVCRIF